VHALVEGAGEHSIRHDDVELSDSWRSGKQIPVGRRKAVRVNQAIRHRDNDVAIRARWGFAHHPASKFVFVDAVFGAPSLEIAKGRREKPRLLDQLTRAAIVGGARLQHAERQTLKRVDVFLAAPQVVVKPDHFRDKTRPDAKWRFEATGHDGPAGDAKQDLTLFARQLPSHGWKSIAEPAYELGCRCEVGKNRR
jgi:hypothetical protein